MVQVVRLLAVALLAALLTPVAGSADVGRAMDQFVADAGGAATVTGPSAFAGQSAGYYSLGNIWTRFPQKTTSIANLQLPSARAGCGGIDLFAGSFSFINSSEIVAMLKAVANNAVGFAFKLAIDTVCPECSKVMDELAQKAQLMNIRGSVGIDGRIGKTLGRLGGVGANAGATGGKSKRWTDTDNASLRRDASQIDQAMQTWATNHSWSSNRDTFERSVATSSRSDVTSQATGLTASATHARTLSREARRYFEEARRIEQRWSVQDGQGVSGALNTSDAFLAFARREIAETPLVYRHFDPASAADWHSGDPALIRERDLLIEHYVATSGATMRAEVEQHLMVPDGAGLQAPHARAAAETPRVAGRPGATGGLPEEEALQRQGDAIRGEVARAAAGGAVDVQRRRKGIERVGGATTQVSLDRAHKLTGDR